MGSEDLERGLVRMALAGRRVVAAALKDMFTENGIEIERLSIWECDALTHEN
jgi:hypothetical protein